MTRNIHFNHLDNCQLGFSATAFLEHVLQELNLETGHFEFTFIDDLSMKALHKKHLQKNSTTDILTFNYNTEVEPEGDIYICVDEAKRNAEKYKQSFDHEIQLLIIHGILHLIGYTDYDEESKKIMFDEQDRILKKIRLHYENTK